MKIYDKKLAYPYFVWMVLFTVVPLFIVVYYALTDSTGSFTLDNLVTVSGYGSVFARSLLLALIATVICLTLIVTVFAAKLVGCTLPLLAKKIGFDPAVMASPFITTVVDAISLAIYFRFAALLLGI